MAEDDEMTGTQHHLYYDDDLDLSRELDSLSSLLQKTQDKFIGHWLGTSYRKMIHDNKNKHQATLMKLTGELEALYNNLAKLKAQKENVHKANSQAANEVEATKLNLKNIQLETDRLLREKERTEKHIRTIVKELSKQKQMVEGTSQSTKECSEELEEGIHLFRNRLGMQFKKISGDRLQIVFTSIDDKDPTRPFCFCVKINPDRSYTISDCEPAVPDIDELLIKLQTSNNFRSFIITMRQRFQGLIA